MVWEAEVQRHEVGIDDEEIGKVFLNRAHDLVVIGLRESLEGGFLDDVAEIWFASELRHICRFAVMLTDVIFPVLWVPQLLYQALY